MPVPDSHGADSVGANREMSTAPPDANIIRIFFSTDNHLGYNEKDPVRGDDSFIAFQEVLEKCIEAKVSRFTFTLCVIIDCREYRPICCCLEATFSMKTSPHDGQW